VASGFVMQRTGKRPRRNDLSVLRLRDEDFELIEGLKELLPRVEELLKHCRDEPPLRVRFRAHHVKGYVYRYLEVERSYGYYGEVVFRVREDSPLAREAEELAALRNALHDVCDALSTAVTRFRDLPFALRQQGKTEGRGEATVEGRER